MISDGDVLSMVLDEIVDRIARRLGLRTEHETYSSVDLPPRCLRRRFVESCRSGRVANAWKDGRIWVCSREAWQARGPIRALRSSSQPAAKSLEARADALLARAGLRLVDGGNKK